MTAETRERFLRAIAERIPPDQIEELHLFPPLRQGGKESGVAVITVRPETETAEPAGTEPDDEGGESPESAAADRAEPDEAAELEAHAEAGAEPAPDASVAEAPGVVPVAGAEALDALVYVDAEPGEEEPAAPVPPPRRLTVYRASYRHTLKGPDRGKWEVEVIEEALAPAYTVDEVVRGVHERAGGDAEPEHLTGEGVRAAITEEPWTAAG